MVSSRTPSSQESLSERSGCWDTGFTTRTQAWSCIRKPLGSEAREPRPVEEVIERMGRTNTATASQVEYAMCVASDPTGAITTASQAEYAMCVASVAMWAITTTSQADFYNTAMCVASDGASVRTSFILASHCTSPERGGVRDGEHAQATVVDAERETCDPSWSALSAGLHHCSKRKMSHTHITLLPSYTMHRQMRQCFPGVLSFFLRPQSFDSILPQHCCRQACVTVVIPSVCSLISRWRDCHQESVAVSLWLSPCVCFRSVTFGRQATKRVSHHSSMSVKTQVRPRKLGASKRKCCLGREPFGCFGP